MKPITEQERQGLIGHSNELKERIEHFGHKSDFESKTLQLVEIALASLTAAPEVSEIESVHPENGNTIIHLRRGGLKNISPEDIAEYEMIETEKFYAAPPVPVIKLPEYQKILDHPAVKSRWNQCIDEVKRLNGLESS